KHGQRFLDRVTREIALRRKLGSSPHLFSQGSLCRAAEENHACSAFSQMKPKLAEGSRPPPLGRLLRAWHQSSDRRSGPGENRWNVGILVRRSKRERGFPGAGPQMRGTPEKAGGERLVLGEGKSLGAERRITHTPRRTRKPAQDAASQRRMADQRDVGTQRPRSLTGPQKTSQTAVFAAFVVGQHFVASWQQLSYRGPAGGQANPYPTLRPFGLEGSNSRT